MKFGICLINPPYDRGLHIKFLEKVAKISNNIISIQPINFLQKAYSFNKKIDENIYCDDIEVISLDKASKLFNAHISTDLGIILIDKKNNINEHIKTLKLLDKLNLSIQEKCFSYVKLIGSLKNHLSKKIESDLILKFLNGTILFAHGKITKATFRLCPINYDLACSKEKVGHIIYLNGFINDNIRYNLFKFYNSIYIRNWIYKFLFSESNYDYLPFIEFDKFNKEWNEEDYKNLFINEIGLTEDEWKYWKNESEKLPE